MNSSDLQVRPESVWSVEPRQGEIPPEESFEISLTANVDDVVRFQDKLQINFLESQSRTIPVEAYGFGTTIVTEPQVVLSAIPQNMICCRLSSAHFLSKFTRSIICVCHILDETNDGSGTTFQ